MDNIKQWLNERKKIYFILALFYDGKINEGMQVLKKSNLLKNFTNYSDNPLISSGAREIAKEIEENKNNSAYSLLISEEHQRLFIGPNEIIAPLWESVYKTKDKLLFGDIELEVRRIYNSAGLDVKKSEPADYLPLQLSFMSRLCSILEKESFENDNENADKKSNLDNENKFKTINENLVKQRDFLKEHILSWIPSWEDDVNKNSEIKFWKGLANITEGWLKNDLEEIEKVISSVNEF